MADNSQTRHDYNDTHRMLKQALLELEEIPFEERYRAMLEKRPAYLNRDMLFPNQGPLSNDDIPKINLMTQTKKNSLIEAVTNTAIGFAISLAASFAIFPLCGIETSASDNLMVTIFYTIISVVRGYVIRRFFNKKQIQ